MSIGILLYLDLEFWEGTLKTLTPSLQENAKYFTTRSYLTLTLYEILKKHNIILDHSQKTLDMVFATSKEAKALEISSGYPLLRIESVIHDVKNTITNLCRRLCIGDKFKFII